MSSICTQAAPASLETPTPPMHYLPLTKTPALIRTPSLPSSPQPSRQPPYLHSRSPSLLITTQDREDVYPSYPLCLLISFNSSCKSSSLILSAKLGISVLASSASSQHRLPSWARSNLASSGWADRRRSTASTFSLRLKRAKWSRYSRVLLSIL